MRKLIEKKIEKTFTIDDVNSNKFYVYVNTVDRPYLLMKAYIQVGGNFIFYQINDNCYLTYTTYDSVKQAIKMNESGNWYEFDSMKEVLEWVLDNFFLKTS